MAFSKFQLMLQIGEDTTVQQDGFTYRVRLAVAWHVDYAYCDNIEGSGNGVGALSLQLNLSIDNLQVSVDLVKVGAEWKQRKHNNKETRGLVEDGPKVMIKEFPEIIGLIARANMTMGCQVFLVPTSVHSAVVQLTTSPLLPRPFLQWMW